MQGNHSQQSQFHFYEVNLWVTFDLSSQIDGYIHFLLHHVTNNDIHVNVLE